MVADDGMMRRLGCGVGVGASRTDEVIRANLFYCLELRKTTLQSFKYDVIRGRALRTNYDRGGGSIWSILL